MKIKSLSLPSARKKDLEPNSKAPLGKSKVSKVRKCSFSNVEMAYTRIEETNPLP